MTDRPLAVSELSDVRDSGPSRTAQIGRLFDDYGSDLLRYLSRRAGPGSAEDLVSETFTVVLEQLDRYDATRGSERAWLYGIATNVLRHHLRDLGRGRAATARLADGDSNIDNPSDRWPDRIDAHRRVRQLAHALRELADDDRDVLLLIAWGGLNSAEVAEALGVPAGTVRSRLHRTRRQLRAASPQIDVDDEPDEELR